jgi:hypothetical protein
MIRRQYVRIGSGALIGLGTIALGIYVAMATVPFSMLTLNNPKLAFAGVTGQTWPGVRQYVLTFGLPILLYAAGFAVLRRWPVSAAVVFAFPVLFTVALFFVYPLTALDVFLYGAQGWTLVQHGANPLAVPPNTFADNPFLAWAPYIHKPTSYGPVWMYVSAIAVLLGGGHPLGTVLLFKLIVAAAFLAGTVLCYAIAERLDAGTGVLAAYALGWNPLALWATVADGHNDMAMVLLILLGCLCLFHRPLFAFVPLVIAGLLKLAAFLLLPVFVVHVLRRRYSVLRVAVWLAIAAGCGWLVLWPLWVGSATVTATSNQLQHMISMSPAATIILWGEAWGYSRDVAEQGTKHMLLSLFAAIYVAILLTVDKRIESALAASFGVLFAVLIVATFWFRFWYIVWPLAIAAVLIRKYKWLATAGIVFSAVGLFVYLFTDYLWVWYGTRRRLHDRLMVMVFLPPLLVLAAGAVAALARRIRQGSPPEYAEVKPAAVS